MNATPDVVENQKRSWIATIITLVVLLGLGAFAWKVVRYADLISSGEINTLVQELDGTYSASVVLSTTPIPDGEFDVLSTDDPTLGVSNAPVTIVEFADFGCPYSRRSSLVMRELAMEYPTYINYTYRDFPLVELYPFANKAAEAGQCAHDQGKFWEYHDKLYQNQNRLDEQALFDFASSLNMNTRLFKSCLESGKYTEEVQKDYEDGVEAGVRGTPTFFINGNRVSGSIPKDVLDQIIQSIVKNSL